MYFIKSIKKNDMGKKNFEILVFIIDDIQFIRGKEFTGGILSYI